PGGSRPPRPPPAPPRDSGCCRSRQAGRPPPTPPDTAPSTAKKAVARFGSVVVRSDWAPDFRDPRPAPVSRSSSRASGATKRDPAGENARTPTRQPSRPLSQYESAHQPERGRRPAGRVFPPGGGPKVAVQAREYTNLRAEGPLSLRRPRVSCRFLGARRLDSGNLGSRGLSDRGRVGTVTRHPRERRRREPERARDDAAARKRALGTDQP